MLGRGHGRIDLLVRRSVRGSEGVAWLKCHSFKAPAQSVESLRQFIYANLCSLFMQFIYSNLCANPTLRGYSLQSLAVFFLQNILDKIGQKSSRPRGLPERNRSAAAGPRHRTRQQVYDAEISGRFLFGAKGTVVVRLCKAPKASLLSKLLHHLLNHRTFLVEQQRPHFGGYSASTVFSCKSPVHLFHVAKDIEKETHASTFETN